MASSSQPGKLNPGKFPFSAPPAPPEKGSPASGGDRVIHTPRLVSTGLVELGGDMGSVGKVPYRARQESAAHARPRLQSIQSGDISSRTEADAFDDALAEKDQQIAALQQALAAARAELDSSNASTPRDGGGTDAIYKGKCVVLYTSQVFNQIHEVGRREISTPLPTRAHSRHIDATTL